MSDGSISKIQLPNGDIYDIKDENISITSTYDSSTNTVSLNVSSVNTNNS